jgi:quercetin dioxygenase-like cupin family protein
VYIVKGILIEGAMKAEPGGRHTMEAIRQGPVIVLPKLKEERWVRGSKVIPRVRSMDTDGEYAVVEETVPPGGGTPLHIHRQEDEIFYVLEGEFEIQCGGRTFRAGKGTHGVAPRNVPHAHRNVGSAPATILVTLRPGGFEGFFDEIDALSRDVPADLEQVRSIARKYKVELLESRDAGRRG